MTLTLIDAEFCTLADLSFLPSSQVNWGKRKGRGGAIGQSYQGTDQGHGEH